MKINKILAGVALLFIGVSAYAEDNQANTERSLKPIAPYGTNPNLLHVFAYKTQEGVIHGAEKVAEVTEKGIAKVKPSVSQAWENTKNLSLSTVNKVDESTQNATQNVNQKIQQGKESVFGKNDNAKPVIEQQSLSQSTPSSSPYQAPQSYAVTDL